ncbi:MAG: hypothetical protein IJL80_06690, partial [Treponema sp.]|nr:hypothetical protein [Treponema sp.]
CLVLVVLLCVSCTAKRQEAAGGQEIRSEQSFSSGTDKQESPSAQSLIQTAETESPAASGSFSDSKASSDSFQPAAWTGSETVPAESDVLPIRSIAYFDFSAACIKPTCYLVERDSFLSRSYHDNSSLYLVGFSHDGKMAYLKEVELDGKGGTNLYFIVQDLVSDEILWQLQSPSDDSYALGQNLLERFISDYGAQIDKKLSEHGIAISPCEYRSLPYGEGGLSVSAAIESHSTGKMMYDMFEIISYSCVVTDGRGRSKKVIENRELMGTEAFVCGCIKNPYEDRLAIVIAEATYGFEGCDILFRIAGCDMRKGF